jgi:hypothetical protein
MVDDLSLVHESLAAEILGLPQRAVLGAYGVAFVAFLAAFRREPPTVP